MYGNRTHFTSRLMPFVSTLKRAKRASKLEFAVEFRIRRAYHIEHNPRAGIARSGVSTKRGKDQLPVGNVPWPINLQRDADPFGHFAVMFDYAPEIAAETILVELLTGFHIP